MKNIAIKLTTDQEHVLRASYYDKYFSQEEYMKMTGIPEARLYHTLESISKLFLTSKSYGKNGKISYKIDRNAPILGIKTDFDSTNEWYEFNIAVRNAIYCAVKSGKATTVAEVSELFRIPTNLAEKAMRVAEINFNEYAYPDHGGKLHESWVRKINKLRRMAIWRLPNLDTIYLRDTKEDRQQYKSAKFIFNIKEN